MNEWKQFPRQNDDTFFPLCFTAEPTGHLKTGELLSFFRAAGFVFKDEEKPKQDF